MAAEELQIPGITLLEELGHGTHSVVYRAQHGADPCAVKLPLRSETGAKLQILGRRFRREAVTLARLRHPSLPRVMEVGTVHRSPYIVMELAAGQTLAERLQQSPLSEDETVELGRQLSSALIEVHQNGLVHRDVKPRNIVFDSATGQVKLVDFGFAASTDAAFRILEPVGTLEYAAPEQISDLRQRVDGRADLYAVGCVLYECLACAPPFPDLDPKRLLHQHVGGVVPDVRSVAPHVSEALASILRRLLARSPDDRYPDAASLLQDLLNIEELRAGHVRGPGLYARDIQPLVVPLLGRQKELDRLREAWADVEGGESRTLILRGGMGSGKSRLARALIDHAVASGSQVLVASCHAWDPRPFSAIRELVDGYARAGRDLSSDERAKVRAHIRSLAGDLAPLVKVLSPLMGRIFTDAPPLPQSRDAHDVFVEGLSEFLAKLVREAAPVVVFVDDLQWLDGSSRRVLRRAIDRLATSKVLFLLATRAPVSEGNEVDRFLRGSAFDELDLGELDEMPTRQLIQAYLGAARLDDELLDTVTRLSDGTPLSTLEVVRMMLDDGQLFPSWGTWKFDKQAVARMHLPSSTADVLQLRIQSLDEMTRSTLSAAAVVGMAFADKLLPQICALEEGHTTACLAEARRSMLVEAERHGTHRFVHDSVREVLLKGLTEEKTREFHQRAAEAIESLDIELRSTLQDGGADRPTGLMIDRRSDYPRLVGQAGRVGEADASYSLASHYAKGIPGKTPQRSYESNISAARLAFHAFDNERALLFFGWADQAAKHLSLPSDPELDFIRGEAKLRVGALSESLQEFQNVLTVSADAVRQASALSRIAWIHEMQFNTGLAWESLEQAFVKLGRSAPTDSVLRTLISTLRWAWERLTTRRTILPAGERDRLEALCSLYYQTGRLATVDGKPFRVLQAAFGGVGPAERLGPSKALASMYLTMSFVFIALGRRAAGRNYLALADDVARSTGDPVIVAQSLQVHSAVASWEGDLRDALEAGRRCLDEHGHWREVSEYCLLAYNQQFLEALRGRTLEGWGWMERVIERVNQHEGNPFLHEMVELGAKAALTALGRELEAGSLLAGLHRMTVSTPTSSGYYVGTYGPRVRLFTERGDLGPGFDALVTDFQSKRFNPRRVHPSTVEYYVQVAHARVHSLLRPVEGERNAALSHLAAALRDLKAAARMPIIKAHALVIGAYHEMFGGNQGAAKRLFAQAEEAGLRESAPWILYAVHRGRAHLLRPHLEDAARDQAKLAETLAEEHGMAYRLRWIREEFGLRQRHSLGPSTVRATSRRSNPSSSQGQLREASSGQLQRLLRLTSATGQDLDPIRQARQSLDEIVYAVRADRGFLFLAEEVATPRPNRELELTTFVARGASGQNAGEPDETCRRLVQDAVLEWAAELRSAQAGPVAYLIASKGQRAVAAAPFRFAGERLGVAYVEREVARGPFAEADGELLADLAGQVPVAFELARALTSRQRAEEELQEAQKLEAMGRLARGIARDFGEVLGEIRLSTSSLALTTSNGAAEKIQAIQEAASRAEDLTRQLVAFSSDQAESTEVFNFNDALERAIPLLEELLGSSVALTIRGGADLYAIEADPAQLDQMILTLAVRARDVMPDGGAVAIETANANLGELEVEIHPTARPGRYVRIAFSDTGRALDPGSQKQIFEPFALREGAGLALGTVYRNVANGGGFIDVESIVGEGTTFRIYWPKAGEAAARAKQNVDELPKLPDGK